MRKKPVTQEQIATIRDMLSEGLKLAEKSMLDPQLPQAARDDNRRIRTIFSSCILVLDSTAEWNTDLASIILRICTKAFHTVVEGNFSYDEFIGDIKEAFLQFGDVIDGDEAEQLIHMLIDAFS